MISAKQIVELYEASDGLSPEDIVSCCPGLELGAVKLALAQNSKVYREKVKNSEAKFTDDDFSLAHQVMVGLMASSEMDNVKFRAAKFVINENKGRHDVQALSGLNINMNQINVQLADIQRLKEKAMNKVIDIDPEHEKLKEIAA